MKKQKRRRNMGNQRKNSRRRERLLESLEKRDLLAIDVILGPGQPGPLNQVPAEVRWIEEEQSSDTIDIRQTNDSLDTAEAIPLGFDIGEYAAIDIRGELIAPGGVGLLSNSECDDDLCPARIDVLGNQIPPVDDGSIFLADSVNWEGGAPIRYLGGLGDSPSAGNSDADFYEFLNLPAGEILTAHLDIGVDGNGITGALVVFNEFGQEVITSDAINPGLERDAFISYVVPEAGDYYVAVAGIDIADPESFEVPDTSRVGNVAYPVEELPYVVTLGVSASDIDFYAIDLNPGDILGVNTIGAVNIVSVYTPGQKLQYQTGQPDLLFPESSPLPRGGATTAAFVADTAGTHYVALEGYNAARYLAEMRLFRPPAELEPAGTRQILFLDFDGSDLNPATFGFDSINTTLTGAREFLGNWGLGSMRAFVDGIVEVVDKDLNGDLQKINPDAGVTILNSLGP